MLYLILNGVSMCALFFALFFFFFQAEDGIRDLIVTGVQTCALPIYDRRRTDLGAVDRLDPMRVQQQADHLSDHRRLARQLRGNHDRGRQRGRHAERQDRHAQRLQNVRHPSPPADRSGPTIAQRRTLSVVAAHVKGSASACAGPHRALSWGAAMNPLPKSHPTPARAQRVSSGRYSLWRVFLEGLTGQRGWSRAWAKATPRERYPVGIVGGGGHGLASAFYLATEYGISDVAVLEKGPIGLGNVGRNTTIIRSNYFHPENIRFYEYSLKLWER